MKTEKIFRIGFFTIWAILFFGIITLALVTSFSDASSLKKEGLITKGVVTDSFFGRGKKIRFNYFVGQHKYEGFTSAYQLDGTWEVGDSCYVIYVPSKPRVYKMIDYSNKDDYLPQTAGLDKLIF